jgi:1-acyl-sn-glycerol-3-phosphate acyltransferase
VKIRGYVALGIIAVAFPLLDLFQRTVVAGLAWIWPSRRIPVMTWWINRMRALVAWCLERVGGASVPMPDRVVESGPGTLIVMNHQSLIDIPLMVGLVRGGYPRIVTRARYSRFIPLISHMVRLYQYPVVDPRAKAHRLRRSLSSLAEAAHESRVPIGIFPEGTRSKDGEIGRFKTRGLKSLLSERSWTIHLAVTDGYWHRAKLKHLLGGMADLQGSVAYLGTVEWTDPNEDPDPFIDGLRDRLVQGLAELRGRGDGSPPRLGAPASRPQAPESSEARARDTAAERRTS